MKQTGSQIIQFSGVSKEYVLRNDLTFKELIPSLILGKNWAEYHKVFTQLSFSIDRGETVGIIGRNGAGKSTLLKLIAGVTYPSSGKISIQGKVAPLIEVGAGFHQELSGYENIFLNGAILGMQKEEIEEKLDRIIAFSELGEFISQPVKRYSTGMYMRLGFSVAVHTNAPVLLIDEVLAVGDASFQRKCLTRLEEIKKDSDRTIIFVSHDDRAVKAFCDRVLLLHEGKILIDGTASEALSEYHKRIG